ncbi:MAG: helix-turn-helix domain-containing protein [bacterium]
MANQLKLNRTDQPLLRYRIGQELRAIRKQRGYTQEQLASKMDISRTTISKIENGEFAMTLDYLQIFTEVLFVKVKLTKL